MSLRNNWEGIVNCPVCSKETFGKYAFEARDIQTDCELGVIKKSTRDKKLRELAKKVKK